jgi:hypothetical protein
MSLGGSGFIAVKSPVTMSSPRVTTIPSSAALATLTKKMQPMIKKVVNFFIIAIHSFHFQSSKKPSMTMF